MKMLSKRKIKYCENESTNYEIEVKKKVKLEPNEIFKKTMINNTKEKEYDNTRPFYKEISADSKKIEVVFNTNCKFAQEVAELEEQLILTENKCQKDSVKMDEIHNETLYGTRILN